MQQVRIRQMQAPLPSSQCQTIHRELQPQQLRANYFRFQVISTQCMRVTPLHYVNQGLK